MTYNQWNGGFYQNPPQGNPQGGAGPAYQGAPASERRIDLLDVVEGVLRDGFSFTNFSRIARASGSNFWIGAAIGAGLVVLAHRPDVRTILQRGAATMQPLKKGKNASAP